MAIKIGTTALGELYITAERKGAKVVLYLGESELTELREAIDAFENPTFEKGDIVKLTGTTWASIGKLRNSLQVIIDKNAFECDENEYEIYKNVDEDFSATLIGKAV